MGFEFILGGVFGFAGAWLLVLVVLSLPDDAEEIVMEMEMQRWRDKG